MVANEKKRKRRTPSFICIYRFSLNIEEARETYRVNPLQLKDEIDTEVMGFSLI